MARTRWALWSLVGAIGISLVYWLAIRTSAGQSAEDLVFEGRKWVSLRWRRSTTGFLRVATLPAAIMMTAVVGSLAIRRRGAVLAIALVPVPLMAGLVAGWLKSTLPRGELIEAAWATQRNTFPSGHAAVATALALSFVAVAPPSQLRRWTRWSGVVLSAYLVVLAGSGWHRPSDIAGGMLLAVSVIGAALALAGVHPDGPSAGGAVHRPTFVPAMLWGAGGCTAVIVMSALAKGPQPSGGSTWGLVAFPAMLCLLVVAAMGVTRGQAAIGATMWPPPVSPAQVSAG